MKYIRVKWIHDHLDDPIWLFSEIDDDRWEVRKVEIFKDGRTGYASPDESVGGTFLGEAPIPPLDEIAADPQFVPRDISADEFERAWANRHGRVIGKSNCESRGGHGCSNSAYILHRTTCCNSYCVEDEELLDLYIDPNDLSRTLHLVQGSLAHSAEEKNGI